MYQFLIWKHFLQIGDRVIGFCDYKAWSEVVAIPSQFVYKMPENMSFQDGAALPMSYLTAYILLFDIANLRQGQSVFTHSVGGGVVCSLFETIWMFNQFLRKCVFGCFFLGFCFVVWGLLSCYVVFFKVAGSYTVTLSNLLRIKSKVFSVLLGVELNSENLAENFMFLCWYQNLQARWNENTNAYIERVNQIEYRSYMEH